MTIAFILLVTERQTLKYFLVCHQHSANRPTYAFISFKQIIEWLYEHLISQTLQISSVKSYKVCICILHDRGHVFSAWRSVCGNWKRTGGELSFTGDTRLTNFKLISNYAALYAFSHFYICHFHCVLSVKWVLPCHYLQKYDSHFPLHTNLKKKCNFLDIN